MYAHVFIHKNGHAEHIHAHCDCQYCVRFDRNTTVEGYDPNQYLRMYENAEGNTWREKLNAMRREEQINLQGIDVTDEYYIKAKPRSGHYKEAVGFSEINNERVIGKWIYDTFGGDITLLAENNPRGEKNPDYLWNEKLWDLKTVSTEKAANSAIRSGLRQIKRNPGGVILNYSDIEIDDIRLRDVIEERMKWNKNESVDIMIIKNGKAKILRFKH